MPRRPAFVTVAVVFLCGMIVWACASSDDPAPTPTSVPAMTAEEAAAPGPYGAGLRTLDMVDETRPTEANREFPGSPVREMKVDVWYPAAPGAEEADATLDPSGGPYPLIIFAHGYSSIRNQSSSYLRHLASHGYVLAAPGFPQTRLDSPGGPRLFATLDQPADVRFVIDQLVEMDADEASFLHGAIDEERIGMTGHSGGGLTTMITAYGPLRDDRIDAALPIAPVGCLLPPDIAGGLTVPTMIVGGSLDRIVGTASVRDAYEAAGPPKYFVEIVGAEHVRFGDFDTPETELGDVLGTASRGDIIADAARFSQGIGSNPSACLERSEGTGELIEAGRQRELLRTAALPFFDAYLRGDPAALRFLSETLPTLDGIRFESDVTDVTDGGD